MLDAGTIKITASATGESHAVQSDEGWGSTASEGTLILGNEESKDSVITLSATSTGEGGTAGGISTIGENSSVAAYGESLGITSTAKGDNSEAYGIQNVEITSIDVGSLSINSTATGKSAGIDNEGTTSIAATGTVTITSKSTAESSTSSTYGVYNHGDGSTTIDANYAEATSTSASYNSFAVRNESTGTLEVDADTINITAEGAANAFGVSSRSSNGNTVNTVIGNADSVITIKASSPGEESGSVIGITAIAEGASVTIEGKSLIITVTAEGEAQVLGIHVGNNTDYETTPDNAASVTINSQTTTVNSSGSGLVAFSNGQMTVNGDLYVYAETAIDMRGNSTMTINKTGENTVILEGNITFETPRHKPGQRHRHISEP